MFNLLIAEIFNQIALLLELQDANPFRIRAYRRAALNIEALSEDIARVAERNELHSIPGIGEDLGKKIVEYLETGKVKFYEELHAKTPAFLLQMLDIPGVGPKTAKHIYQKFAPKNLDDLESLANSGKIRTIPGMKEKTERNILDGIQLIRKHHERTLLGVALPLARQLVDQLGRMKGVVEIAYAGSTRRMCETIRDIDILITSKSPKPIMNAFTKRKEVWKILAQGNTKSSVIMQEGIQVDLRVVEDKCFGASLLYFTGSKAHNIQLRSLAKRMGYKINEYGIFNNKTGRCVASRSEEEMYKALGLAYIAPELREDQGEIAAAAKDRLPKLLEIEDIKGDLHIHSNWSDGNYQIDQMAEAARKRGLKYIVLTDHSQSLKVANGLSIKNLFKQIETVRKLNRKLKGITILAGSEVDILGDGSLDFPNEVLKELDFVIGSIHTGFKQSKEQITRRITKAMQNKYMNLLAHPTGRLMGERNAYEIDYEEIFKVARETNTAIEINSYPKRLDLSSLHAKRAREMGIMLAINTDAHVLEQLGNLEYGVATARRAWCEKKHILNCLDVAALKKRILK